MDYAANVRGQGERRVNNYKIEEIMKVDVLLGLQWGDEGKGKVVDVLTPHYDVVARFREVPMRVIRWNLKVRNTSCVPSLPVFPGR